MISPSSVCESPSRVPGVSFCHVGSYAPEVWLFDADNVRSFQNCRSIVNADRECPKPVRFRTRRKPGIAAYRVLARFSLESQGLGRCDHFPRGRYSIETILNALQRRLVRGSWPRESSAVDHRLSFHSLGHWRGSKGPRPALVVCSSNGAQSIDISV